MTVITIGLLIAGLVLLVVGAEALVRGASRLAAALGIAPLVIGLTIVAFGTSSPELAVSISSTVGGSPDIAVGNVVGSNIFNILFILGLSALITPLIVAQQLVRLDVPIMIGVSVLVLLAGLNGAIERWEGALLFTGILAYTGFLIWQSRRETKAIKDEYAQEYAAKDARSPRTLVINSLLAVAGLALLVLGSRWFVDGATQIARAFGVSELIIGLTLVAAGTSLPEVATSVIAALRGERDIAVGNVVGSNLFNLLAVLGLTAVVAPDGGLRVSPGMLDIDIPFMIAVAVACLPIFFTGHVIARWEAAIFLAYYVAYTVFLFLTATNHDSLALFQTFMLWFVAPLTLVTLVLAVVRELRSRTPQTTS
ncbi:MAG: calcium/sodium antiporter [Anaerolineales bacterium]|nr:calcium/sodium antiporter [Anaerolineales bacterium]